MSPRNAPADITTVPEASAATIGSAAMTESGNDAATDCASGDPGAARKFVLGQNKMIRLPIFVNSIMRAGATYGSPGAGPNPPKPVDGTDVSMNSRSS